MWGLPPTVRYPSIHKLRSRALCYEDAKGLKFSISSDPLTCVPYHRSRTLPFQMWETGPRRPLSAKRACTRGFRRAAGRGIFWAFYNHGPVSRFGDYHTVHQPYVDFFATVFANTLAFLKTIPCRRNCVDNSRPQCTTVSSAVEMRMVAWQLSPRS